MAFRHARCGTRSCRFLSPRRLSNTSSAKRAKHSINLVRPTTWRRDRYLLPCCEVRRACSDDGESVPCTDTEADIVVLFCSVNAQTRTRTSRPPRSAEGESGWTVECQSGRDSCGGRTLATAGPKRSLCREPVRRPGVPCISEKTGGGTVCGRRMFDGPSLNETSCVCMPPATVKNFQVHQRMPTLCM